MITNPQIFVVDDEEPIRRAFDLWLRARGMVVHTFASAEAFLAAYTSDVTGWLITDARMPLMSGLDLCRELRSRSSALRTIIITGQGSGLAVDQHTRGAAIVLEKPFAAETVERILRQHGGGPAAVV